MKILEICNFSAGISGVWTRAYEEARRLAKNNEVYVFSSNIENDKITNKNEEVIDRVNIKRFPVKNRLGFALFFNFKKEALALEPDIIICHGYRKPYLTQALKVAKKLKIPIYLVTHAPFVEKKLRSKKLNIIIGIYDKIYGKRILNSFDKIIAITKWEIPYLLDLGVSKSKVVYIPNGIPEEFFEQKTGKEERKILFLGRISPIKDLEVAIKALGLLKDKKAKLEIVGPAEDDYPARIKSLVNELKINNRVKFSPAIYNLNKKIKKMDSCRVFILPSKREAMPQSLIEAMARRKIVISSDTEGGKEIVKDGKNGFLFNIGDASELANKLDYALSHNISSIKKEARKSVEKYSWDKIIEKIEKLYFNKS